MANAPHPVLRFVRRVAADDATPDVELLRRFAARRDEAAFALLVRRHGPMVFGVCRRLLPDADAEDAFQATFLLLARRAPSLDRPALLANWLHGVARRTALKARATAALRQRREAEAARPERHEPSPPADDDLRAVLDDAVRRLPERYRIPLLLCHFEGRTHDEIARQLGCPRATVTTRLTRGRERLRQSLARRGVALSLAGVVAALTPSPLPAALAEAAQSCATGVVADHVSQLAKEVAKVMFWHRLKGTAVVVLFLLTLGGVGLWARHASASPQDPKPVVVPAPAEAPAVAAAAADPKPESPPEDDGPAKTVKESAPVVVKTEPQAGDTQVDATKTKEIRVTFSKEMQDKSWSWTQVSKETFPETTGKPSYDKDKKTCVLPVKLEPGKAYVIWINPQRFQSFRDTDGRPAVFYPLVFETKP